MNDDIDAKRTLSQNAKMWPMLRDFSRQLDWPHTDQLGNWRIAKMPEPAWKAVLTAGFEEETAMAQGWNGGTVMIGASTSNYGIRRMASFIDWLYAAGNERGVVWSEKSLESVRLYGTALSQEAA